ncbi:hypothetical protein FACS189498_3570 [Spirochaetia bacterium]|nr:hypothetical protein FACS189498_3570 [Spirochaetia bacterium]
MKINGILLAIAFAVAALIGYGLYAVNGAETDIPLANALGGGIVLFITLAGTIAVTPKNDGGGGALNIRLTSGVFFALILVEQIVFCFVPFSPAPYIVVTGLLLLVYVLIAYAIGKTLQSD